MILAIVVGFLVLLFIGFPVAWALICLSLVYLLLNGVPLSDAAITLNEGVASFTLMAIPFFMLAGSLMDTGGVTKRLVEFADALVGRWRGGLAYVNILTNMIMAGMSGSAVADAAATGSVLIPAMQRAGYTKEFASAITASAATIGPVIPPSVAFLVYGGLTGVPVGTLFVAGAVPGMIMGIFLAGAAFVVGKRTYLPAGQITSCGGLVAATFKALPALTFPAVIMGGFVFGIFTPTEASAIAVALAVIVGIIYRELTFERMIHSLEASLSISAKVLVIVGAAHVFSVMLTREQVPQKLVEYLLGITDNSFLLFALMMVFVLILGCFMDAMPINVILSPILYKVAVSVGINPIQFGVAFVLALMIGLLTPPVGMNLYVVASISGASMRGVVRELVPFLIALVLVLVLVVAVPSVSLFLPNLAGL